MKPKVQEYDNIEIVDVDTDEGATKAGVYSVRGLPTLVVTKDDGTHVDSLVGAVPEAQLKLFMRKHV
jgi:thioredoxin-like negative regulator of GroEL